MEIGIKFDGGLCMRHCDVTLAAQVQLKVSFSIRFYTDSKVKRTNIRKSSSMTGDAATRVDP